MSPGLSQKSLDLMRVLRPDAPIDDTRSKSILWGLKGSGFIRPRLFGTIHPKHAPPTPISVKGKSLTLSTVTTRDQATYSLEPWHLSSLLLLLLGIGVPAPATAAFTFAATFSSAAATATGTATTSSTLALAFVQDTKVHIGARVVPYLNLFSRGSSCNLLLVPVLTVPFLALVQPVLRSPGKPLFPQLWMMVS